MDFSTPLTILCWVAVAAVSIWGLFLVAGTIITGITLRKAMNEINKQPSRRRGRAALASTIAVGLIAGIASLVACTAPNVRAVSLMPAIDLAWPAVQEDVVLGAPGDPETLVTFNATLSAFEASIEADYPNASNWTFLRPFADAGVDVRLEILEIGPTVAESRRERIINFTEAVNKFSR